MIAGKLTDKVKLLKPTVTKDKFGAEHTTYAEQSAICAQIIYKDAGTSEQVGEFFMDQRIDVLIRDQHQVGEKWRVKQLTGLKNTFHIRNIVPDQKNMLNRLICERVNE